MAGYHRRKAEQETDGGEAAPRPLKAFRLVDTLAGDAPRERLSMNEHSGESPDPKGTGESSAGGSVLRRSRPVSPKAPPQPKLVPSWTELPADGYCVLSVTPEGEGETVAVVLAQPKAEGGVRDRDVHDRGVHARVMLHLLVEQYADLGVQVGGLTPEEADALLTAGKLCAAIRRGMGLLAYGDQSARRLASKLTARGIDREIATAATAYLTEHGYIREDDTARLRAEQGVRKGWGLIRIREDLQAQGFPADVIDDATEGLSEVDFVGNCAAVIRKRYGDVPEDRSARQKMTAALMRLGYDSDEIREAMRVVLREGK